MTQTMQPGWSYLDAYLQPLRFALDRPDVTDIYINQPHEMWLETLGGSTERHAVAALDAPLLERLSRQIAAATHQGISRAHPLLSASLAGGERVQVIAPPATRAHLAIAIRKHVSADLSLDDYEHHGAFDLSRPNSVGRSMANDRSATLGAAELLRQGVRARRNILISGGTSTGKTTFLNALIREIPLDERLILIEDTPELQAPHANAVGLIAVRGGQGEAQVTADDLVSASLRMRPDRILLGELRGMEAFTYLRAVNTGHPGSMTTIHADSTSGAVEQLVLLVLQGGTRLSRSDVQDYIANTIDIFVQLDRKNGRRYIADVQTTPRLTGRRS